jgi:hypothetical protein
MLDGIGVDIRSDDGLDDIEQPRIRRQAERGRAQVDRGVVLHAGL